MSCAVWCRTETGRGTRGERTRPRSTVISRAHAHTRRRRTHAHATHKYTLACTFSVTDSNTHPVKWRSSFIPAGKVRSFRVQPPWSKNIHRGILLTGKWVTHGRGEMYVLGTEGHIPVCTPLTKTNEHKAWKRVSESQKLFYCSRDEGKKRWGGGRERENKKSWGGGGLCIFLGCIQRLSTQLPVCVPAHERSCLFPNMCV